MGDHNFNAPVQADFAPYRLLQILSFMEQELNVERTNKNTDIYPSDLPCMGSFPSSTALSLENAIFWYLKRYESAALGCISGQCRWPASRQPQPYKRLPAPRGASVLQPRRSPLQTALQVRGLTLFVSAVANGIHLWSLSWRFLSPLHRISASDSGGVLPCLYKPRLWASLFDFLSCKRIFKPLASIQQVPFSLTVGLLYLNNFQMDF